MKRKTRKKLPKIFLISFFFLFLLILSRPILNSKPLLVKNVIVTTDYDITENQELFNSLKNLKGKNVLFLNEKKLAAQLLASSPKIGEIKVVKEISGRVVINIRRREPLAAIYMGQDFFLVDKEGLVFSQEREIAGLPSLELSLQNISIGSRIDEKRGIVALMIIKSLKGKEEIQRIIEDKQDEIQVELKQGSTILFPVSANGLDEINAKISALQMLLDRFRIEGKQPAKIDLRFLKPVVSF